MAEALSNETITYVHRHELDSERARVKGDVTDVYRGVIIGVDAAPSDTTIYTVPSKKTFYLTAVTAYTNNGAHLVRNFYDSAGDAISGSSVLGVLFAEQSVGPAHQELYPQGIPFRNGITMSAADLIANKTFGCIIIGYLM